MQHLADRFVLIIETEPDFVCRRYHEIKVFKFLGSHKIIRQKLERNGKLAQDLYHPVRVSRVISAEKPGPVIQKHRCLRSFRVIVDAVKTFLHYSGIKKVFLAVFLSLLKAGLQV